MRPVIARLALCLEEFCEVVQGIRSAAGYFHKRLAAQLTGGTVLYVSRIVHPLQRFGCRRDLDDPLAGEALQADRLDMSDRDGNQFHRSGASLEKRALKCILVRSAT
jgi:hypothetical protein